MLIEGDKAKEAGEVPVSCCLLLPNQKPIYTVNRVEKENDPLAHAEILALEEGFQKTNSRYLKDGILIVSLEPCLMCLGAIIKAGIKDLYYVLDDPKAGGLSHYASFVDESLHVIRLKDDRFKEQMDSFFTQLRAK